MDNHAVSKEIESLYALVKEVKEKNSIVTSQLDEIKIIRNDVKSCATTAIELLRDNSKMAQEIQIRGEQINKSASESELKAESFRQEMGLAISKMRTYLEEIERIQEEVEKTVKSLPEEQRLEERINELVEHVDALEAYYDEKLEKIEARLAGTPISSELVINRAPQKTNEVHQNPQKGLYTIRELIEENKGRPAIIRHCRERKSRCAVVESYDEKLAHVIIYSEGKPTGETSDWRLDTRYYTRYTGHYLNDILGNL
ncbi:MAG: hypothetical protein Q4D07_06930 [Selenomonadaceae bacterium]|nr:hypothetical protein [Selenomonadaceae bacterium]